MNLEKLQNKVKKYDYFYHDKGISLIPDEEYDCLTYLINDLQINKKNVDTIPAKPGKYKLPIQMWSLDKKFVVDSVDHVVVMDKLDGVSCLLYKKKAFTRGNGIYGTNITSVINPDIFDKFDNESYAVRGELVVKKTNLDSKFSNCRTMVCSYVSRQFFSEKIEFVAYELLSLRDAYDKSPSEQLQFLNKSGIPTVDYTVGTFTTEQISDILLYRTENSPYCIDGVVISYEKMMRKSAMLRSNPKYCFAFKKNTSGIKTTIKNIIWNIGKSGTKIPIIEIEQIVIDGTKINRVSGHNILYMKDKQLGIGAVVEVIKSGKIIPYISRVYKPSLDIPEDIKTAEEVKMEMEISKMIFFAKLLKIYGLGSKKTAERFVSEGITPNDIILGNHLERLNKISMINKNLYKTVFSLYEKIRSATDVEILASVCFFGDGFSTKKIEKLCTFPKEAQEFLKQKHTIWN
nr:MAG: DNA ligase [Diabrotica toursvirus 3a]